MGLDSVEIILRTEDEFSITISDEEAEASATVGDLYRVVLCKLDAAPGCLTSKAFYLTRRALVDSLGLSRRSIRPSTPLSPLLPDETRRRQWQTIRNRLDLATPPLRIPADLKHYLRKRAFFVSSTIAVVLCIFTLWLGWWPVPVFILSAVFWIALFTAIMIVLERVSAPALATELPADTAGELSRVVLSLNYGHFVTAESNTKPTDEDVWRRLVDIICDQLQIPREEVVPNSRFIDDLDVS